MGTNALAEVKIADFTWVVAGPLTIKHLADHGAQVIHIESSTRPELLRLLPPYKDRKPGLNRSAYNACVNNNKYGLSLDMNHPRAKEVLHRLIGWADVVAENFTPGTMARWGFGYEDLKRIRPDIILFSTSQMGQTGPRATIAAYGAQLVSLAGFSYLTGWPDREPTGPYGPYTDATIPSLGTAAILTALIRRRRTGKGTHIDLSQFEAALNFISPALLEFSVKNRVKMRNGNRSPNGVPHGVYPCRGEDRWCAIAIFNDDEWRRLCQTMGRSELATDPRFASFEKRKENEDEIDRLISGWTLKRPAEEAMRLLQEAGIAAGVAQTNRDLLESDPQLGHRFFFRELEHKEIGKHRYEAPPYRLSKTPCELIMPGPRLGEHNEYVCKEILGLSDKEYEDLVSEGAVR
ncbi:MAG: CaiB/BaiF CoA transferase family protein [Thermodesulfobacteriota bacterium]